MKLFKEKILIIEDDVQIRNFMVYALENAGFSVKGGANGKDGISYMVRKNADLIFYWIWVFRIWTESKSNGIRQNRSI